MERIWNVYKKNYASLTLKLKFYTQKFPYYQWAVINCGNLILDKQRTNTWRPLSISHSNQKTNLSKTTNTSNASLKRQSSQILWAFHFSSEHTHNTWSAHRHRSAKTTESKTERYRSDYWRWDLVQQPVGWLASRQVLSRALITTGQTVNIGYLLSSIFTQRTHYCLVWQYYHIYLRKTSEYIIINWLH